MAKGPLHGNHVTPGGDQARGVEMAEAVQLDRAASGHPPGLAPGTTVTGLVSCLAGFCALEQGDITAMRNPASEAVLALSPLFRGNVLWLFGGGWRVCTAANGWDGRPIGGRLPDRAAPYSAALK